MRILYTYVSIKSARSLPSRECRPTALCRKRNSNPLEGKGTYSAASNNMRANMWNEYRRSFRSTSSHLHSYLVTRSRSSQTASQNFSRSYSDILIWLTYHYWLLSWFLCLAFPVDLAII